MIKNRILFERLNNKEFIDFIEDLSRRALYSSSHYKNKLLPEINNKEIKKTNRISTSKTALHYVWRISR